MKNLSKVLLIFVIIFSSCGPNVEEKEAMQKVHDDSLRLVFENEKRIEDSIKNEKVLQVKKENDEKIALSNLKEKIADKRTEIRLANEELTNIKGFHLGRLPEDKQREINYQYKRIQSLEQEYEKLQDDLNDFESGKNIDNLTEQYLTNDAIKKALLDSIAAAERMR